MAEDTPDIWPIIQADRAARRAPLRQTRTYATLAVSKAAFEEIAAKLREAGYGHAFSHGDEGEGVVIDMHGIGLIEDAEPQPATEA